MASIELSQVQVNTAQAALNQAHAIERYVSCGFTRESAILAVSKADPTKLVPASGSQPR